MSVTEYRKFSPETQALYNEAAKEYLETAQPESLEVAFYSFLSDLRVAIALLQAEDYARLTRHKVFCRGLELGQALANRPFGNVNVFGSDNLVVLAITNLAISKCVCVIYNSDSDRYLFCELSERKTTKTVWIKRPYEAKSHVEWLVNDKGETPGINFDITNLLFEVANELRADSAILFTDPEIASFEVNSFQKKPIKWNTLPAAGKSTSREHKAMSVSPKYQEYLNLING